MSAKTVVVLGSGLGSLSCAALLAHEGFQVTILEQNYLPGGCTSSYWRKGFVFESGATTVVGLEPQMPLGYLLRKLNIDMPMRKLDLPMTVHLSDGTTLKRFQQISQWIAEASRVFPGAQRAFWEKCMEVSEFVWQASTRYVHFPPGNRRDLLETIKNFKSSDLRYGRYALISTEKIMKKYGVDSAPFRAFVDEQLMITAQNTADEVNFLFGAAALCYTNYDNYYIDGGLINLVQPLINYIEENSGKIEFRTGVESVLAEESGYLVRTTKGDFQGDFVVSGLPYNNTLPLFGNKKLSEKKLLGSQQLNGAFQMGIGFRSDQQFDCLHHQIHLSKPLPGSGGSKSFFLSINHSKDQSRSDKPGHRVASISCHVPDPANNEINNRLVEEEILTRLQELGFLDKSEIIYQHSSTPKSWHKWTRRKWGFVGGYPQYMHIKPWQMPEARLDKHRAYMCGDTAYPGQGIPGTTLSGIIAAEKLISDWGL